MIAGGVIAAGAFVISGLVQIRVNQTLPDLPDEGRSYISIMNSLPNNYNCNVTATVAELPGSQFHIPVNEVIFRLFKVYKLKI